MSQILTLKKVQKKGHVGVARKTCDLGLGGESGVGGGESRAACEQSGQCNLSLRLQRPFYCWLRLTQIPSSHPSPI